MLRFFLLCVLIAPQVSSAFTFRNAIVTCEEENPQDEAPFGTILTTNRLQPHLGGQKCYKISIQYANIPVLHKDSVSEIRNANFLILENNNIEEIEPGAFRNTKLKEALSLKNNKLTEIRREVFNDVQVPVLILSYNFISYIDYQAFDNMTLLESVHLDHNKISAINTFWFRQTPNLNNLNLQHNLIQEIPAFAFQNFALRQFSALKIDLSHNLIRTVHSNAFARIRKLYSLNLAFNRLTILDRNWLKGIKINILDISNNYFRCLDYGLAEPYSVNFIDGNPWECGCLSDMKKKELVTFGKLEASESFKRCNILINF